MHKLKRKENQAIIQFSPSLILVSCSRTPTVAAELIFCVNFFLQQEAHEAVSREQAAYREKKMSSEDVHNILLDVQLTYKREPAPKAPNSVYDSTDKLNIIIKGLCKTR